MFRFTIIVLCAFSICLPYHLQAKDIPAFKLPMVCDRNNNGFYTDADGQVTIRANGDILFKMSGLEPNAEYECSFFCRQKGNVSSTIECFPNDDGDLHLLFRDAASDATNPGGQCVEIRAEIFRYNTIVPTAIDEKCFPGWDFSD